MKTLYISGRITYMKSFLFKIIVIFMVVMIPLFSFVRFNSDTIEIDLGYKVLNTYQINKDISMRFDFDSKNVINNSLLNFQNNVSNNLVSSGIITDVLETQYGTMSAYGLDCSGCSGTVGARYDARGNNLRYYDSKYGELRIVAGDKKYPYGTVVRVKDSKIGTFNAIVLDRGGDIGIGRRYMFDLLFYTESEASSFGLSKNTTFEILRYGY